MFSFHIQSHQSVFAYTASLAWGIETCQGIFPKTNQNLTGLLSQSFCQYLGKHPAFTHMQHSKRYANSSELHTEVEAQKYS